PVWNALAGLSSQADSARPAVVASELAWLAAAAASASGAVSVWPIVARSRMRVVTTCGYTLAALCGVLVIGGVDAPATVFQLVAFATVVVTGMRYVEWSPLGRGILLIVLGSLAVVITEVLSVFGTFGPRPMNGLTDIRPHSLAALLIAIGAIWVLAETWVRAHLFLRRTRALHQILVDRFPEVRDESGRAPTTILAASDVVAHVMDALYIQTGAGMFEQDASHLPEDPRERADYLMPWIADPLQAPMLGTDLARAPEGMSTKRWVGVLADSYQRYLASVSAASGKRLVELQEDLR
ncbi:MAG: hypothetical protein GX542_12665, partial [Rhodococcus sp.]|nr:hypothetical protein [Rhodococcus sp. (in: high G+C Gram-positive bacteria)]